ncbi:Uncharacterised protein [Enterococcus faecium]|nr:Uncharacterised protein [Enterococcus faecium]SMJ19271.1 Uncharacterised protein [Enterococcus faecium]SMJ19327.1 Uncharacterised protein [Enterococcus faecium]SMJ86422.1 Uncharacterised protein [Enterococcus faecium]SMJ94514.1 Uncharacterised protein [Enterococcus faecium]
MLLLLEWVQCCLEKDQMDLIVPKEAETEMDQTAEKEKIENQKRISVKLYQKKLAKLEELWDMPMNVDYQV